MDRQAHSHRRPACRSSTSALAAFAVLWTAASSAQDLTACGPLQNAYGPYDYRTAGAYEKQLVEGAHFTRNVETLQRGNSGPLGAEIDYTLRAFPNHPRALMAMMKLGERDKTERPRGARYSVACYFERAVRFQPDDPTARLLRGIYLVEKKQRAAALPDLEFAREHAGDDANVHYNLGLTYFDLQEYDKALDHAKKAYALGFPLQGLKNKLKGAKKWQD